MTILKSIAFTVLIMLVSFPSAVWADTNDIIQQMHDRQLIISGQKQGSVELARRELKELMGKYAKEEGKDQLSKALEWMESQGNDIGFNTDIESLYKGFNRYAGRSSVVPLEMSFVEMAAVNEKFQSIKGDIKDYTEHAERGYSYAKRLYELSGVFEENQEPAAKRLSKNLSLLADAMSNYGEKIPLVGAFIAAYGNVTSEMLKSVDRLGERLNARNPWLNEATYGDSELIRAYRHQLQGVWLKPVLGLRDCYVSDDGPQRVYIFDSKSRHRDRETGKEYDGAFVPVSQYPPFDSMNLNQTVRELRRRYRMFDSAGIKNPGVRQVIREAERIIRIEPQLDYSSIHAGEGFTIHALAYYAVDNRPVPRGNNIDLEFFQDEGYLGTETQSAALGQYITWTAPSSAGKYGIQVDLSEDSKSAGWRLQQGKPATASYIVGAPTRFALKPSSVRIATTRRQPLNIEVILQDEKGNTFSSGDLIIDVRPGNQFGLQVPESYLDPRPVLELSGADLSSLRNIQLVPLETAVIEPGPVHVSASYRDGSSRMANATAILRVQEPRIVDGSRIVVKTREKDGNVDMAVYVSDETEQKVRVGTVTVTALSGGLFRTHRGSAHDVTLDLSRPGYATWMPGKEETKSQIFRIAFSGGAWQDAMYSPVTTEWTLNMKDKKEETPLFTGTEPPAEPHEIQAPSDEIYIAETGYQVEVSHNEWKKVEEEQVPIVLIPDRKGPSAGNLFAGTEKPVPEETEKAGQGAGNLFFGEQFGIKGAEPVKKESLPASSSKTEAPLGGSLFAGIDAPVASSDYNEDKAAPLDDSEQLPADDPNMRELIIQSVKITNDSGLERPLSAGQTARIYLVTRWNGSFMERVRIKIKVDQFTALDEIHEFRDSMGTYKTDFMKKIIIPDEIIEKSLGIHNIQVTCELVPVSNPKIKLICKPYSTEFMMVKPGKKLDIKILK